MVVFMQANRELPKNSPIKHDNRIHLSYQNPATEDRRVGSIYAGAWVLNFRQHTTEYFEPEVLLIA
jgi:hypothetical protein